MSSVNENRILQLTSRIKGDQAELFRRANVIAELRRKLGIAIDGLEEILYKTPVQSVDNRWLIGKVLEIVEAIGKRGTHGKTQRVLHGTGHQEHAGGIGTGNPAGPEL